MDKKDPHKLTYKEALELLAPHKEKRKLRVHTFTTVFALMGCSIDLTTIKKRLKESEDIRLSGPNMRGMGHGLAYYFDNMEGYVYLKTDEEKINALHLERGI